MAPDRELTPEQQAAADALEAQGLEVIWFIEPDGAWMLWATSPEWFRDDTAPRGAW